MDNSKPKNPTATVSLTFQLDEDGELVIPYLTDDNEQEIDFSPLSEQEKILREESEKEIKDGIDAFQTVGYHLFLIKTEKLFRSTHRSFEQYCKEVWQISRVHANRKITAYQIDQQLKSEPKGSVAILAKETHGRVMADCPPDQQVVIARKVKENVGDREPTQKDWQQAKKEVAAPKVPKKAQKPAPDPKKPQEPANVIPMPKPEITSGAGSIIMPVDFHDGSKLLSLQELARKATLLYNISSDSTRKPESQKLLWEIKATLERYAKWEEP